MINKYEKVKISHQDSRRSLKSIFNGDFTAKQVKILDIKRGSILGNHYHEFKELFYIFKGLAKYTLEDIYTGRKIIMVLKEGERLIINKKVKHTAEFLQDTITIEATEEEYRNI